MYKKEEKKEEEQEQQQNCRKHDSEGCWSSIRDNMRHMILSAGTNQTQMIMVDGHNSQRK